MSHTYNSLFFVTIAAFVSPWLSIRVFRSWFPSVVLEIIFGYVLGPHLLGIASTTNYITFLANFGFSYLMFLSGLELDFDLVTKSTQDRIAPWLKGLAFFLVTLAISLGIVVGLHAIGMVHNVPVATLILSTTSMGVVLPALKGASWTVTDFGQEVLLYAAISDIATLILFTAYVAMHTTGNSFSVLLVMVVLLLFVVVYRGLRRVLKRSFFGFVENASNEFTMRGAFALVLAFLAFSETLGTEVVIGAFLAGAIISLLSERHSLLTQKLNTVGYGFLIPIFFVNVGMHFNIGALSDSKMYLIGLGLALVGMYLNKLVPALWFFRKFKARFRFGGGLLLASRLSLVIAASQISSQSGLLSPAMSTGFVLLAVITCTLSPILFSVTMKDQTSKEMDIPDDPPVLHLDSTALPDGWRSAQIEVHAHKWFDVPLRSLGLPQELLVISISRGDERIIPRGHTRLEQFDLIQVLGSPEAIRKAIDTLS